MSIFHDRYATHPTHALIGALENEIGSFNADALRGDVRIGFDRFVKAFEFFKKSFAETDPELVTIATLKNVFGLLQQLQAQFGLFCKALDANSLNAAMDNLLDSLFRLPRLPILAGPDEFFEALANFRESAIRNVDEIKFKCDEIAHQNEGIEHRVQQFKEALDQQQTLFEAQKGRLDQIIGDGQSQFNQSEQERSRVFLAKEEERAKAFSTFNEIEHQRVTRFIKEAEKISEDRSLEASEKLQQISGNLDRAKKIVGLIANTGMSGHYQKVANREWWAAEIFRRIAILFLMVMAGVVVWVVSEVRADNFNWEVALFRMAVAVTLLAPWIYSAHESDKHRTNEMRNRRLELELASIQPYLETLPSEKSQIVIEKLAERYFGNEPPIVYGKEAVASKGFNPEDLLKLFEYLAKIIKP
ncbi:hypothetical protein HYR69_12305 [Candidatus Sumerlaeota bacterium]|nr:hypothetical protein [Candidatus Sumerlaeota bacterium]